VFLHLKGLSAKAKHLHNKLVQLLGSDVIAYSTMTKDIWNDAILQNEPEAENRAEDQCFSITDNAILRALEMMPFPSIREIAKMTLILPTNGFRRLTKSLHLVLKRLRWALHSLSDLQKIGSGHHVKGVAEAA
jgi:hypothetical protein